MNTLTKTIIGISMVVLTATSCQKEGLSAIKGNYSFKISGSITAVRDETCQADTTYKLDASGLKIDTLVTIVDQNIVIPVDTRSGQMEISTVDSKDGTGIVSMDVIGGEVIICPVNVDGDSILLEPSKRHMVLHDGRLTDNFTDRNLIGKTIEGEMGMSGEGRRYDNIVIFDLHIDGDFTADGVIYHITGSDMVCRGRRNE